MVVVPKSPHPLHLFGTKPPIHWQRRARNLRPGTPSRIAMCLEYRWAVSGRALWGLLATQANVATAEQRPVFENQGERVFFPPSLFIICLA